MKIKAVRGFKDILPPESEKWAFLEKAARSIFSLYGFQEIRIPLLEKTKLFARSIGESTDIVEKEMYTFLDKNKESLTLRPEATAGICRAVIEHGLYAQKKILKLFTIGPMFRHERPQKGRLRQFHQIDAEVLGSAAPEIDAEIICLALELLKNMGLGSASLEINSLGCKECRLLFRKALKEFLKKNKDLLCPDCQRRAERNPLRILDCKQSSCQEIYSAAPSIEKYWCNSCKTHLDRVLHLLNMQNISYRKNPHLVRGLDYYVRTTFEIKVKGLGAQNTVAAGGRYDGLIKSLGGPDIPGIGFAIGIERLLLVSSINLENIVPTLDVFFISLGEKAYDHLFRLASKFRKAQIRVELDPEKGSLKAQMRRANKLHAKFVLIVGEEELKNNKVILKDMETGHQEEKPWQPDLLIEELKERLFNKNL